ncbi:hypothetical protein GDO86_007965 [Hymenochirus boettgeri]|uniref:Complement component C8 beta chain n=1 Tax=Hymenochirus boettgeri TaxID=247094 RepID=A0A8T2IYP0_9PIPI|nr:hypothetical protein GDO86_007965 [Hymenochirus boettgeri]
MQDIFKSYRQFGLCKVNFTTAMILYWTFLLQLCLFFCSVSSSPPQPIDCTLSSWSSWSSCDPCQNKRYRYAQLVQPSQFNGQPCELIDSEEESCKPTSPCRNLKPCEGFRCVETGRCITRRLLCNGDDDCGDLSDEKNCKSALSSCSDDNIEQYWGIEKLASGINLFSNNLEGLVLDHRYYAGGCSPHFILDINFRKPYNVESYIPVTRGKYEFSLSEHESYSDFERNFFSAESKQTSFGIGFHIPAVFEFGFSYSDKSVKTFIERTRKFSHTKSKILRARSNLEVARYKLKPRSLMLHTDFFQRVKKLPLEYVYGEYRDIFRDYGTHFITEATLGGVYEYTLILNSERMKNEGYSFSDVQSCVQAGYNIGANIEGVWVSGSMSAAGCLGLLKEVGNKTSTSKLVEDFVAMVRGGASEEITALAYKELPSQDLMQEWGDAVYYNPDIINLKASPLYELVTAADFIGANLIQENMKRALEEFQAETSSCRCQPCQNNGIPFLNEENNRCECICPQGFSGSACEETKRRVDAIDGNWSCWSEWARCSNRGQTRQRECNNPAPKNGGNQCAGPSTDTKRC